MNHNDDEIDTDSQMFINKVYSLAEEINGKLGRMQVHSPRLFEKMQKTLDELYNLADDVKEGQITLNEREQLYANLFKIWNSRRG